MSSTTTLATPALATTQTYDLDVAHSHAEFAVRHMMIATVKGRFALRGGTLELPADVERAKVVADIDVATVHTGMGQRDDHLRSADFFDAANHPTMRFESTRVEAVDDANFRVEGQLTIRGAARPVTLDVEREGEGRDPWGKWRVGLVATTTLDRRDFGLTWNQALETGGVLVGDKVKVTLHVEAIRRE